MTRMELTAGQQIEVQGDDYDEIAAKAILRFVTDLRAKDAGEKRYATFSLADGVERRIEPDPEYIDVVRFFSAKGELEYSVAKMRGYLHGEARPVLVVTVHEGA